MQNQISNYREQISVQNETADIKDLSEEKPERNKNMLSKKTSKSESENEGNTKEGREENVSYKIQRDARVWPCKTNKH